MTPGVPIRVEAEVVGNRSEGRGSRRLVLRVDGWPGSLPGQFVMLSPGALPAASRSDPLLPRPMAVYRVWGQDGGADVEILYKITGRGTALLAQATPGERVRLVGPLGRGFPEPEPGHRVLLVGGGTGTASLYELAGRASRVAPVSVLLGARSRDDLMAVEDFKDLGVDLHLVTEDGSTAERGLVTEPLVALLDGDPGAVVYACGPTPMMRRCAELAVERSRPCWVSLENPMACGFGVCLGCAVPRKQGGFALVCRDGPVFDAAAVLWDDPAGAAA